MQNANDNTFAFDFQGVTLRALTLAGAPWFVAADVCRVLEIANKTTAIRPLSSDEKGVEPIYTPGGTQRTSVISESGLYKLVMRSDKPQARAFQDWVTRDVLPAIRKDGAYVMGEEKVATGEMSEDARVLGVSPKKGTQWLCYLASRSLRLPSALSRPEQAADHKEGAGPKEEALKNDSERCHLPTPFYADHAASAASVPAGSSLIR
ncbi:BRO family protein [Aurantimonas sp. VKM B-3413]|uniref:BRO-N domain-containing protein n=1 Tax=Aurantimonas sp. VKM B-3413 TaxID=2779401 RepID=UPI001E4736B3|nr:BRO family protein [Aurantimonas sp. VKM B-3413]MCB8840038.1 hypothetical protein [Aurantimonas sp. VKM B-3413]